MGWSGRAGYKRISGELAESEGRNFQRKCLPLLRVIWPEAIQSSDLGGVDAHGIDILVWQDHGMFPVAVQCKGFKVTERELGSSQIRQCRESIRSFGSSGFSADTYVLVHNREARSERFRRCIDEELAELRRAGRAREAYCWDRQTFVSRVFDAMLETVERCLLSPRDATRPSVEDEDRNSCVPVESVPYSVSLLEVDQHRKIELSSEIEYLADPADELLSEKHRKLVVLIGEFGVGKTTVAMRALLRGDSRIVYVRGAELKEGIVGTRDLLAAVVDLDRILEGVRDEDRESVTSVARGTLDHVFRDADARLVLLIDGLDESIFANRAAGLQWLFNCLWEVRVPIIITTRTEHWYTQQTDLARSFGVEGTRRDVRRYQTIELVELKKWTPRQIVLLARRFEETLQAAHQRERVEELVALVESGEYESYYGDIPTRPLFLRMILETVAESGIHRVGRAGLFAEAISHKVFRDVERPLHCGGAGRPPLTGEDRGRDAILQLSWHAMYCAARIMVRNHDGSVDLLPHCSFDELRVSDRLLDEIRDPATLVLHSLLVPVSARKPGCPVHLRFAHRAFQEFLLARVLLDEPGLCGDAKIPEEIVAWRQSWLEERPETPLGPAAAKT